MSRRKEMAAISLLALLAACSSGQDDVVNRDADAGDDAAAGEARDARDAGDPDAAVDPAGDADAATDPDAVSDPDVAPDGDARTDPDADPVADPDPEPDLPRDTPADEAADPRPDETTDPAVEETAAPYAHTIAIDGTNDFTVGTERFATSTTSFYGYVSWDASYVYVGMEGSDVGSGSAYKWVLVYIGGSPGTATGVTYSSQGPALPFAARWHVRWKATNAYTNAQVYSGSSWTDAAWVFTGDVYKTGNFLELRIPRSDIGSPSTLDLHLSMINEESSHEGSWAAVPSTSFADGFDPNYTRYYHFDLTSPAAPNSYAPFP